MTEKLNFIDLFAGAGGLSEGFIRAGFNPIAHVEINKDACDTLKTRTAYHFLKDKEERKVASPKISTNGDVKFIETDLSYLDDETVIYYYYFVGIAETKNAFYKVICSGSLDFKNQYKGDFQKILYSIKD